MIVVVEVVEERTVLMEIVQLIIFRKNKQFLDIIYLTVLLLNETNI